MVDFPVSAAYQALDDLDQVRRMGGAAAGPARAFTGAGPAPAFGRAAPVDAVRAAMAAPSPAAGGVFAPYIDDAQRAGRAVGRVAQGGSGVASRAAGLAARWGVPVMAATTWLPALVDEIAEPSRATQEVLAPWQQDADRASAEGRPIAAIGNRAVAAGAGMAQLAYRGVALPTLAMLGSRWAQRTLGREALPTPPVPPERQEQPAPVDEGAPRAYVEDPRFRVFNGLTAAEARQQLQGFGGRAGTQLMAIMANQRPPTPLPLPSGRDLLSYDVLNMLRERRLALRQRLDAGEITPTQATREDERIMGIYSNILGGNPNNNIMADLMRGGS